jgi:pimeloyl-ACP methyl ester carboxylesterase
MAIVTSRLDGLELASEITGEGRPVLLLHGWGGRIESMQPVAAALAARGYAVHNLDLPGFGRSALPPPAPEVWGVADYARFVAHYLEAANLKPVNLIGHSFGGRIGIVLGADYPQHVEKIVLADSAGVLSPPTARDRLVQIGRAALKLPGLNIFEARLKQWGRDQLGSEDLKNAGPLEATFRKVVAEDLLPRAARIAAPTLLIWGDQDRDTPFWQGQTLEKTIPDAGLVVFQGAGHFAYQERLADFVRIVDTFFKGAAHG